MQIDVSGLPHSFECKLLGFRDLAALPAFEFDCEDLLLGGDSGGGKGKGGSCESSEVVSVPHAEYCAGVSLSSTGEVNGIQDRKTGLEGCRIICVRAVANTSAGTQHAPTK